MNRPFEIRFDFPLAYSDLTISLKATAELHSSDPYFVVSDFHFTHLCRGSDETSILPAQEIKQISSPAGMVWVHKDSEKESLLSRTIGQAIEHLLKDEKAAGSVHDST